MCKEKKQNETKVEEKLNDENLDDVTGGWNPVVEKGGKKFLHILPNDD